MGRISSREFLPQLRSVGVEDLGRGVQISEDVQLVYIADDVSHLIAPRPAIEGYVSQIVPLVVTRASGISFRSPPDSAVVVTWMRNDGAIDSRYQVGTLLDLTNDLVAGTIDFSTGPAAPRSTFQHGSRAASASGVVLPSGADLPAKHPDIVVGPGDVFLWIGVSINSAMEMSWSWREVPL